VVGLMARVETPEAQNAELRRRLGMDSKTPTNHRAADGGLSARGHPAHPRCAADLVCGDGFALQDRDQQPGDSQVQGAAGRQRIATPKSPLTWEG
jgi:hypothetical protein